MRICIDLDGVICEIRGKDKSYADIALIPGTKEKIGSLKKAGHYIIIYTARHNMTCNGNIGLILARQGLTTLQWLEQHRIPYDEIHFGKPYADVYIDDNAIRFTTWDDINHDGRNLPSSSEMKVREDKC